ncbi:MAG: NAD(P)H-dependent glycerol-3-phosphate dehydrogenase [Gammaproteobacteria bacterium]
MRKQPLAVIGAGSWGTALAIQLARNGHPVSLWGRDAVALDAMAATRTNARYLPDVTLPDALAVYRDLRDIGDATTAALIAVPSEAFRTTLQRIAGEMPQLADIVWATKGIEVGTGKLLEELVTEELGDVRRAVLSGPSFALEVARGQPTAVTAASRDSAFATQVAEWFHSDTFRVYTSDDVTGVEFGGALKNVLAIAAGIADGLGFGANARAALITRGLNELLRLGDQAGARRETLMGLAGVGDLVLTCTDNQSRNRRLGLALGRGESLDAARASIGQAVEGATTARVVRHIAKKAGVEMPIHEQVFAILYEGQSPREAVTELLAREAGLEF